MYILYPSNSIYTAPSQIAGIGIFARANIKRDEVIEECPIIIIPDDEIPSLTKTKLFSYYFAWGKGFQSAAICLGFGSLYNHSYKPNANYIKDTQNNKIIFVAVKNIKRDEEILVNYNGKPDDKTKLWFEIREGII